MGPKALFIEHPKDHSNRPKSLGVTYDCLGPDLGELFRKAFVKGLHAPNERPSARDWERALITTWDSLFPCPNPSCTHKWFVFYNPKNPVCPFCGARVSGSIPLLRLRKESKPGQWTLDKTLVIYNGNCLFKWHSLDNVFPDENADRTPQGDCVFRDGRWFFINKNLLSLTSPGGNRVPPNVGVELKDGAQIRLSQESHGRMAEVEIVRI
jgi:hypothetical protein